MTDNSASLDVTAMSQEAISRLILDQLKFLREEFRKDMSDLREEVRQDVQEIHESVRDVNEDIRSIRGDINEIKDELGDRGGVRDRLTTLEIKTQQAIDVSSKAPSSYPAARKKSIKDHAPALGAGAGGAGLLYALVELANTFLKTK